MQDAVRGVLFCEKNSNEKFKGEPPPPPTQNAGYRVE
jgi:hypothetical protein